MYCSGLLLAPKPTSWQMKRSDDFDAASPWMRGKGGCGPIFGDPWTLSGLHLVRLEP